MFVSSLYCDEVQSLLSRALVIKSNLVKYLLTCPQLSGRMAQWVILTSCLDIECIGPTVIKGQAVADLLAIFLGTIDFSPP